ncbi:hypothetical protein RB594_009652 [Gaeumannomyces avenae]
MSTIATPREIPRRVHSTQTPTSSSRPSLDDPRSQTSSPSGSNAAAAAGPTSTPGSAQQAAPGAARRNRAALREYYNLKKAAAAATAAAVAPTLEVTDDSADGADGGGGLAAGGYSEVAPSEMDAPGFDAAAFVARAAAESSLADLLRTYTRVLSEARALDAEKKALVYDNYSKLITATETIRKMRANMDPLNPMASTLDPAIAHIYNQASSIREEMRREVQPPEERGDRAAERARRERTHEVARLVLAAPARVRELVGDDRLDEAQREWALPRRLLLSWKERGAGGPDVDTCLEAGDAAIRSGVDAQGKEQKEDEEEESEDEGGQGSESDGD